METILILVAMSFTVQFLVDRIKSVLPQTALRYLKPPYWSIMLSLLMAAAFGLDIFAVFGIESALPYLPQILTAIAISAGADPLHNFFAKIREWREFE